MRPDFERKIALLADVARRALEVVDPSKLAWDVAVDFREFPRGACGSSSIVLGQFLSEHGLGDFMYMNGRRSSDERVNCHTWLQQGSLIVDITGDQFPDRPRIFVGRADPWFAEFEDTDPHVASTAMWGPSWVGPLSGLYAEFLEHVPAVSWPPALNT